MLPGYAIIRVTSTADAIFQCEKSMFHPGLADLFEAVVIVRAAAHPIEILRHDRMIGLRQCKPIDSVIAVVTGICPDREPHLSVNNLLVLLAYVFDVPNNNIRAGHK